MKNLIQKLIDSKIIRQDGRLNSAVIRRSTFKTLDIYQEIIETTNFLVEDASIQERIFCIKNEINMLVKCSCGKALSWNPSITNYSKTCGDVSCWTNTNKRIIGARKMKKTKKINSRLSQETFLECYNNKSFKLLTIDDCVKFIEDNLNEIISHGLGRQHHLINNEDLITSIIFHTSSIIHFDQTLGSINERCYLLKHKLMTVPKCESCQKNMTYDNFKKGYSCKTRQCYIERGIAVKHKHNLKIVKGILEKNGFELKSDNLLNEKKSILKCGECGDDFDYWINNGKYAKVVCPKCHCKNEEGSLFDYIKSIYDGPIERCYKMPWTKNKTSYQEIDIYLPELKIGFEYDGIYWHSNIDKNYHLRKTESCAMNGIKLLHIFSNEWIDPLKRMIWKSMIGSMIGKTKRVFARKCTIIELSKKECSEFLISNHLQGDCKSSIKYGLELGGELISVMTFGKARFSKKYDFELIRFCSNKGMTVVGGFSKLLAHFRKFHQSTSIVTYADRRFSFGNVYDKNGFIFSHASQPNYFYWKKNQWHNREKFQKHKLKVLLENFDESLSEGENMKNHGWNWIFDCGNLVYTLQ